MDMSADSDRAVQRILSRGFERSGMLAASSVPKIAGPGSWWGGSLNVEQLAVGSVALVSSALNALSHGQFAPDISSSQVAAAFGSSGHLRINGETTKGFAEYSGFFRTSDGWIRTHANYPHHERRLLQSLGAESGDELSEVLGQVSSAQAQELIAAAGGVAAAVQTRRQWLESTQGQAAQQGDWAQFSLRPSGAVRTWQYSPAASRPLSGLRVLDLTRVIAGPTATRTLAALGAQVLRVDAPQLPELEMQHVDTGFGKRSTLLDLSSPEGSERMAQLLREADVLIAGYRQGSLARFGLSEQSLAEKYPDLIIAELDAWGYEGPWVGRRGFDSIVQAACGISDVYRTQDGKPGALPVQALDHATGYGLAAAIITMVQARSEHRGVGSVRFSLARTAAALFEFGAPTLPTQSLDAPRMGHMASASGKLDYTLTPFVVDGEILDFLAAPPAYGQDEPIWI
ncbi:CoA transferase [Glutamicibacter sp. JL.03c]|uniref:CoA transferase n=1 Tax=Glutamicibacter sp. JL.03c TaxID=2984842 RepID=UPI0021F717A7|nr:CoA transferase [Glutamicibacter sp. JL.03c]UYQ78168.1 CoA transferase [Glutamicibacter sp. JL.03c]